MASIYANAYFTIIAADGGDANHGLQGTGFGSCPRSYTPDVLKFSPECSMVKAPEYESQFNRREWHKRGWTYQERILSDRNMVFFRSTIFWECCQSIWFEELAGEPDGVTTKASLRQRDGQYSYQHTRWPDFLFYSRVFSLYNNRLLTYQSNALAAFSATLRVMCRSFKGGFFYGIPEIFFDLGLLWRPNTPVLRRTSAEIDKEYPMFPSWSWIGWEGNVIITNLSRLYQLLWDGRTTDLPIEISPAVVWYKTNKQNGKRASIDNSYHTFQRVGADLSKPLLQGWSRERPSKPRGYFADFPDDFTVFRHVEIPDIEFFTPVPLPAEPLLPSPDIWDKYLTFRTKKCSLHISGLVRPPLERMVYSNLSDDFVPFCLLLNLTDGSGLWAGMICSNTSDPKDILSDQEGEFIIILLNY
ncbi:hypothetical protein AOQ84DRAFT_379477 [Glonium stellatum]|uniref:Heterokaryon incompatibility domain-containing protein n=1 Tax=Glonium stellatum TaxID=574774 RepID=A0A8E2JQ74_9PEZI|nr:hypothetical protein AOQ84DRAFT_379477 [Glonium stellatum]